MTTRDPNHLDLTALLAQIAAQQGSAKKEAEQCHELQREFSERVRKGETTGDRIKDFVLMTVSEEEHEAEYAALRTIQDHLSNSVGKFVLVANAGFTEDGGYKVHYMMPPDGHESFGCMAPPDKFRFLKLEAHTMVVKSGSLTFDISNLMWGIDCETYVTWDRQHRQVNKERGPFWNQRRWMRGFHFTSDRSTSRLMTTPCGADLDRRTFKKLAERMMLELSYGDEQVFNWLKNEDGKDGKLPTEIANALDRTIEDLPAWSQHFVELRTKCLKDLSKQCETILGHIREMAQGEFKGLPEENVFMKLEETIVVARNLGLSPEEIRQQLGPLPEILRPKI